MIIYPAIDLKSGRCVRLYKGDMAQETAYNDDPDDQAVQWAQAGFSWIHVVDLDGAVGGEPVNTGAVQSILKSVDIPVQLGGGIRSLEQIEFWLQAGISRVILGTSAVRDPDLVRQACNLFPGQIVVGIDARNGMVAVEGWAKDSDIAAEDLARAFEDAGVAAIIYTDIDRDGTGEGVNLTGTCAVADATEIPVIASGGIGKIEDLEAVKRAVRTHGLNGVVVGKAFYEGQVAPLDALKLAAQVSYAKKSYYSMP